MLISYSKYVPAMLVLSFVTSLLFTGVVQVVQGAEVQKAEDTSFSGCICGIDESRRTLVVIYRNGDTKEWEFKSRKEFTYDDSTKLNGYKDHATIAELRKGKLLKMARITGMTSSGLTGDVFDIKTLKDLVGERVVVHYNPKGGKSLATLMDLQLLFGGESLPAMIGIGGGGEQSARIISSGKCPCSSEGK